MENKYLIGSQLLGLTKAKDSDYLSIDNSNDDVYKRKWENECDIVYRSKSNIDSYMNFQVAIDHSTIKKYIINYQLDKDIIKQDFPYEYHILDKKEQYINLLKYILDKKLLNMDKSIIEKVNDGTKLCKIQYHIAYLVFILENDSVELTSKQKQIIQQIHDRQMPIDYFDTLVGKINKLFGGDK